MSEAALYTRIFPPQHLRSASVGFARDEEMENFVRDDFTSRGGLFFDPEHGHLTAARIGVLWCAGKHIVRGSEKIGTMELVPAWDSPVSTWGEAMKRDWLRTYFGQAWWPHFLTKLSAPLCLPLEDRDFFAVVDHEVCHGDVAKDEFQCPRFNKDTGEPVYKLRPHDYEGFVGTTERWGAVADGSSQLVAAGLKKPRYHWVLGRPDFNATSLCGNV